MDITIGGIYQHYKGGIYRVIGVANHSETLEKLVIYKSLENDSLWARPLVMWNEEVVKDGKKYLRFTYINC